jgi:hypothetical protein
MGPVRVVLDEKEDLVRNVENNGLKQGGACSVKGASLSSRCKEGCREGGSGSRRKGIIFVFIEG